MNSIRTIDTIVLTSLFIIAVFMYSNYGDEIKWWEFDRNGPDTEILVKCFKVSAPMVMFSMYSAIQILRSKIKGTAAGVLGLLIPGTIILAHSFVVNVVQETYAYYVLESIILYTFAALILGGIGWIFIRPMIFPGKYQ